MTTIGARTAVADPNSKEQYRRRRDIEAQIRANDKSRDAHADLAALLRREPHRVEVLVF